MYFIWSQVWYFTDSQAGLQASPVTVGATSLAPWRRAFAALANFGDPEAFHGFHFDILMNFTWHMWHIIPWHFRMTAARHTFDTFLAAVWAPVNGMRRWPLPGWRQCHRVQRDFEWLGSRLCDLLYTPHVVTCHVIPSWIQKYWHLAHLALTLGRFWPSLVQGSCDARPSFVVELLRSMQKRSLDWFRQRCFAGKSKHLGRIAFHVLNVFREVLTFFFAEMLCDRQEGSSYRDQPPPQVLEARQHAKTRSTNI